MEVALIGGMQAEKQALEARTNEELVAAQARVAELQVGCLCGW